MVIEHTGRFRIWHHAGLTSCLSVKLHEICKYRDEHGKMPEELDCSDLFMQYRDYEGENINDMLMSPYHCNNDLPYISFRHAWQFKWYNKIHLATLSQLGLEVCAPSPLIMERVKEVMPLIDERTCILYRGNDKQKEIRGTPYEAMAKMAKETGSTRFIVQTDEEEFFQFFKGIFPDTIAFAQIPRIHKNGESFVLPEIGKRAEFAVNFLSALIALSKCPKACITTGNIGLWFTLFRGNTEGIWQYNGRFGKYKKLK